MNPSYAFFSANSNYQGPEHTVEVGGANAQPSRCTLSMFHLDNASQPTANDRLGVVLSALYSFWIARQAAVDRNTQAGWSSPDELLTSALQFEADGGTDFTSALERAQEIMTSHWSTERTPVMIFLSDGEDHVRDEAIYDVCRGAVRQGRPLSFHSVSFGQDASSSSLRRMAQIALEVQNNAPHDPLLPAGANVPSSYTEALDTVRLAETFLGIAESLRKPRGFLFSSH
ncbi:hypothetical protein EDB92DRAFT_1900987 [Lactarius akahatsu]|uniref:VWFA domain-containing protein n=1 Tax=Lactarius akahatsu TaxID=416441 RepID=A0AAD4LBN5_9AGAM|nr:hypothetical protein EDB92DRAFT_1900987 [Lactarius akahatsu]